MATPNLDLLRVEYRDACKAYRAHAKIIEESAKRSLRPLDAERRAEERALSKLTEARHALLAAMSDLARPGRPAGRHSSTKK
jgi:hypothetical protein